MFLFGCVTKPLINGKNSKYENKAQAKIESVEKVIAESNVARLDYIGQYSFGIGLSTNLSTTKILNDRILTLAIYPDIKEIQEMRELVSGLESSNNLSLIRKDVEISRLQNNIKQLAVDKELAVSKYIILANETAGIADTTNNELQGYKGFFGLNAVGKGLWQFAKSSIWFLAIGSILFIVLRVLASTNPIAGAIFSIFNVIGGYFVRVIKVLIPKSIEYSGNIATSAYTNVKSLLIKIVDSIQMIKQIEKTTGKDATIKELFVELEKTMDIVEKDNILKIKKDLGYN